MPEVYREMMTQEERIELLKAVAECAPEEMGAVLISSQGVKFSRDNGQATAVLTADDDMFDAEAIIAMLDAMEGANVGCSWHLTRERNYPDDRFCYYVYIDRIHDGESLYELGKGETRAEAVARAFVEVFKK